MCVHTCACAPRSLVCVGEGNAHRLIILVIATVILIVIIVAVVTKAATTSWHLPCSLHCGIPFRESRQW